MKKGTKCLAFDHVGRNHREKKAACNVASQAAFAFISASSQSYCKFANRPVLSPKRSTELPARDITLVICRSGARSDAVAHALARIGRTGCANVAGGMQAWQAAGLAMEPEGGRVL